MSSDALERAEALLAADAANVQSASWWFAEARGAARDVVALAAEVARLEQERDQALAKVATKETEFLSMLGASATEYVRAEAAEADLAAARAREQRLRDALVDVVADLSHPVPQVVSAVEIARAALAAEPATGCRGECGEPEPGGDGA